MSWLKKELKIIQMCAKDPQVIENGAAIKKLHDIAHHPSNQSLMIAVSVLLILIIAIVGSCYLFRNELFSTLERYSRIYSRDVAKFIIYAGFTLISLIVSVVIYGILRILINEKNSKYGISGSLFGFMIVLVFLIVMYENQISSNSLITIDGNITFKANNVPVKGAIVSVKTIPGLETRTDYFGNFSLTFLIDQEKTELILLVKNNGNYYVHSIRNSNRSKCNEIIIIDSDGTSNIPSYISEQTYISEQKKRNKGYEQLTEKIESESSYNYPLENYFDKRLLLALEFYKGQERVRHSLIRETKSIDYQIKGLIEKANIIKEKYNNKKFENDLLRKQIKTINNDLTKTIRELNNLKIHKETLFRNKKASNTVGSKLDTEIEKLEIAIKQLEVQTQDLAAINQSLSM